MSNMTPAEVRDVLERMRVQASIGRCHDNTMSSAELIRQIDEDRAATTAVAALIDREAAYRNALEHIAGSCEGRAAEVASVALNFAEAGHG